MNKEQVIDFLTECGMWVKDGSIKKADVDAAVALIADQKVKSTAAVLSFHEIVTIDPDALDSENDKIVRDQIEKDIKGYDLAIKDIKIADEPLQGEDGCEIIVTLSGSKEELADYYSKTGKNPENIVK